MLEANAKILTNKGFKRVKDLKNGDKIYNHKHELMTIKKITKQKVPTMKVEFAREIREPIQESSTYSRCVAVHYYTFVTKKNQLWVVTGWSMKRADYDFLEALTIAQTNALNEKKQNEKNGTNYDTNALILKDLQNQIGTEGVRYTNQLTRSFRMLTRGNYQDPFFFSNKRSNGKKELYSIGVQNETNSCILECGLCTFLD